MADLLFLCSSPDLHKAVAIAPEQISLDLPSLSTFWTASRNKPCRLLKKMSIKLVRSLSLSTRVCCHMLLYGSNKFTYVAFHSLLISFAESAALTMLLSLLCEADGICRAWLAGPDFLAGFKLCTLAPARFVSLL